MLYLTKGPDGDREWRVEGFSSPEEEETWEGLLHGHKNKRKEAWEKGDGA